jgi:hypothetical protein
MSVATPAILTDPTHRRRGRRESGLSARFSWRADCGAALGAPIGAFDKKWPLRRFFSLSAAADVDREQRRR